jgi:hypothetical protein
MAGWVERLGFDRDRRTTPGDIWRSFRRGIVWLGFFVTVPSLAAAAEWNAAQASSNLGVFALSDAEMAKRKITVTPIGELELPTGQIIACDPLTTGTDWPALSRSVKPGHYPVSSTRRRH